MTADYVQFYLNSVFAQNDVSSFLALLLLFMGRIFPIITQAPYFGAKVVPHSVKVVLGLSLFVILMPQLAGSTHTKLGFNNLLLIYFFKEIFIGTILGFLMSLPFMMVQSTGIIIDHQRGGASLMVNDPTIQNQSSPLGTLFNMVLIYLFFKIDGPFTIIDLIAQSYEMVPPDKMLNSTFFNVNYGVEQKIIGVFGNLMIICIQLGAPALIMILMTDFFLGVANRLAPQVQISFLGMPLKSLLGLLIVCLGWIQFNEEVVLQTRKSLLDLAFFVRMLNAPAVP